MFIEWEAKLILPTSRIDWLAGYLGFLPLYLRPLVHLCGMQIKGNQIFSVFLK